LFALGLTVLLLGAHTATVHADSLPPSTPTGWMVVIVNDYSPCNGGIAPGNCFGTANITTTGSTETTGLASVTVGGRPLGTAISPDGSTALVVNVLDATVSPIDLKATPPRSLPPVALGTADAEFVAITPDGRTAYVVAGTANAVFPVDLTVSPPRAGRAIAVGKEPAGIAISPDGATAWVANVADGTIQPISLLSGGGRAGTAIPVGDAPQMIALSPDGSVAYVNHPTGHTISAVSLTGGATNSVDVGMHPQQIALTPDGSIAYVPNEGSGTITPIRVSGTSMSAGPAFALPHGNTDNEAHPWAAAVTPDGKQLYVTDGGPGNPINAGNTVTAYDISGNPMAPTQLRTMTVGFEPRGIAITPIIRGTTRADGPSTIATSLPTPREAFASAAVVLASAAVAVGGTLFITFPAQLFNLTFQENYRTIAAWWERRLRPLRRLRDRLGRAPPTSAVGEASRSPGAVAQPANTPWRQELPAFALVVAAGALLGALLDPHFGANWSTVETYIGVLAAILIGITVGAAAIGLYHRLRHVRATRHLRALPLGLAVALACVAISRLANFQPGYLYGVVCMVAFDRKLTPKEHGHTAALSMLAVVLASMLAWLLWLPVNDRATVPGAFAGTIVLDNLLAAVFVGGFVGAAIGLLPLRFLPGGAIKAWSRSVWVALFAITMFGVVDFIIRSPAASTNHAPLVTTAVLFILFSGVSVGFREYFARRWRIEHGVTIRGAGDRIRDLLTQHPSAVADPSEASLGPAERGGRSGP
jgi:DNA-binding beta-propeller fold protein YncE